MNQRLFATARNVRRGATLSLLATCVATLCLNRADAQWSKPVASPGPMGPVTKPADAHECRIMTSNVEFWSNVFLPKKVLATTRPGLDPQIVAVLKNAADQSDEENWEVARNVLDVQPDIWCMQEGCGEADLNYFNTQFLDGYFETVHVFKTNDERGQNTAICLKKGFTVLEWREDYHNEPLPAGIHATEGGGHLFARGPGFALVQAPDGTKFWVGTNHAKSKRGNSVDVTKWRNAEATRTNQIINELKKSGTPAVFFMGDMNDEIGYQEFEIAAGGSAVDLVAGTGPDALTILTKPLVEQGYISYHGSRAKRFQSFIDHCFATPEAAKWVTDIHVFSGDLADVVSDHYSVYFDINVP